MSPSPLAYIGQNMSDLLSPDEILSPYQALAEIDIDSKLANLEAESALKRAGFANAKAVQKAREAQYAGSLAGRFGLDAGGIPSKVVTQGAAVASSIARFGGSVEQAFVNTGNSPYAMALEEGDYEAYNRIATGKAIPGDYARMQQKRTTFLGQDRTVAQLFDHMEQGRMLSDSIGEQADLSSYVDSSTKDAFAFRNANQEGTDAALNRVAETTWSDGKTYLPSNLLSLGKDFITLAANAVKTAGDNPEGTLTYLMENSAQFGSAAFGATGKAALAAFTAGYATDYYNKGIEAYQAKNNGQLPSEERRTEMLLQASALAAAEYAGTVLTVGAAKFPSLTGTAVKAGEAAGVTGLKTALKAALERPLHAAKSLGQASGSEAATEGVQTYLEGEIIGKPASAQDIYLGATIGGLTGGIVASPNAAFGLSAGDIKKAKERSDARKEITEAVKTGNADIFLDETSPRYDLGKGVSVLHAVALDTTKTPEERATASKRAQDIVEQLTTQLENDTALLDSLSIAAATTPALMQSSRDTLIAKMEEAAAAIPAGEALSADAQALLDKRTKNLAIIDKAIEALTTPEVQEAQARVTEASKQIADLKPMAEELKKQRIEGLLKTEEESMVLKHGTSKDVAELNLRAEKEAQDKLQEVESRISDLERDIAASTDAEHISSLEKMLQQAKEDKVEAENSLAWRQGATKQEVPDVMIKPTDPNYAKFKASAAALAKAEQVSLAAWEVKRNDDSPANVKAWEDSEDVVQEAKTKHRTLTDLILAEKAKGTGTSAAPKATSQGLIIRSVIRTNNMTPEQAEEMANDTTNDLNEAERSYLRKFSAARIAENELQTLESVDAGIFVDSVNGGHRSIDDYHTAIGLAIAENNPQKLQALMSGLRRWATSHSNKYRLMKQAFATVQKYEKAQQVVILKETDGSWRFASRKEDSEFFPDDNKIFKKDKNGNTYKDNKAAKAEYARVDELIKEGGHITVSKGSGKYVAYVGTEAVALRTAYSELSAAVSATTEGITVVAIPEASTQPQPQPTPISAAASAATPMASQEAQEATVEVKTPQAPMASQQAQESPPVTQNTQASVVAENTVEQSSTSKTPVFDKLPSHVSGKKTMTYAGIGSRTTPANVMAKMTEVAAWLAKHGYTLRSGHADGADTAFENGADTAFEEMTEEQKESFTAKEIFTANDVTDTTRAIAKEIHPKPSALRKFVLDLMAQSTNQVFGKNLDSPVDFVLTWTPDGAVSTEQRSMKTGGTGQAIDMASRKGIPVINMANKGWGDELRSVLKMSPRTKAVNNTTEQAPEGKSAPTQTESIDVRAKAIKQLESLLSDLNVPAAIRAATMFIAGEFKLDDGTKVRIPDTVLVSAAALAYQIVETHKDYPMDGTHAEQTAWVNKTRGIAVPYYALEELLSQNYQAAEAVHTYGYHTPLSASKVSRTVFTPAIINDWAKKRIVADGITDMSNLCIYTSKHTAAILRAYGYSATTGYGAVTIPGGNGNTMDHYVAMVNIDGEIFVVDQPQAELFTWTGKGNRVRIKQRTYTPRFIPVAEVGAAYNTVGLKFSTQGKEFISLPLDTFNPQEKATTPTASTPAVTSETVSPIPVRKDMSISPTIDTVEAVNGLEDDVVQEDTQEIRTEPTIEVTDTPEVEDVFVLPVATSLNVEEAQKIIASHPILKQAMEHIELKLATAAIPSGAVKFSVVPAVKTKLEKPTEGYYYEVDGKKKIVLFVDNIKANKYQSATDRLVWVAFHEIMHRGVAELALSKEFMTMLKRAAGNDYVKAIAKAIYEQRQLLDSKYHVTKGVAIEEALSELSAAFATNNTKYLEETYDVIIPLKEETKTNSWVRDAIGQVKTFYARLTGKELTLAQTRRLLLDATRAGIYGKDMQNNTLRVLQEGISFLSGKIVQEAGNGETVKPLASIADFFTTWKNTPELTQWLVTEKEFSSEQNSAMQVLKETITEWMPLIDGLVQVTKEDFGYSQPHLGMFIRGEDAKGNVTMTLEENVKAAIAYALYTFIRDEGGVTRYLEDENINLLLNRSKYAAVTSEERTKYGYMGYGRELIIAKLGKTIVDALGLKANKNNEQSLMARLEYGLGSIAYGLAIKTNTVSEHSVFIGDVENVTEKSIARNFARFPNVRLYNPKVQPKHLTAANEKNKKIVVSGQGSQSIVAKLMGVEYKQSEPTLKPSVTTVNDVKGSFAETPDRLVEINNKENKVKNYVDSKMYTLLLSLGNNIATKIMGFQDEVDSEGNSILQKTERVGVLAANESILRNWENAQAFVNKTLNGDFMLPFFLKQIPWGPQRVGIEQNVLNPNADKMARWLLTRAGWKSVIKFSEPQEVDSFLIVVAAALNIDIDKISHKTAMENIQAALGWKEYVTPAGIQYKVENQDYATVIQGIIDQQYNEVAIPMATQELMLKLVGEAETNMHALKALVALSEFMYRQNVGDTTFTTDLTAEVDGVTNGPMLTQLMWGTFPDAKFMEKGGFFGIDAKHKDFNVWKEATKENDLYQHTSKKMGEVLIYVQNYNNKGELRTDAGVAHQKKLINAFYVFTKELVDKTQQVTSAARKLIKTPVTQYHFGSASQTASKNVFYSILEGVYKQAKAVGNDPVKSEALRHTLNTLIADTSLRIEKPPIDGIRDFWLNQFELTSKQKAAIKSSYDRTIGAAVEEALETTFSDMAITRNVITAATNTAFYVYDTTFQFFRKQALASTGKQELTRAEEEAIHEKLKPMFPKVATWFSNNSENSEDSQLPMMKGSKRETSIDKAYRTNVDYAPGLTRENGKPITTSNGFGQQRVMEAPAVLMVSEPIHSSDSGGSHLSIEGTEALNNHDANLTSVFDLVHRAKALNKSIFKVTLEYSPVREILKGFLRTLTELEGVLNDMPTEEASTLLKAIHARLLDPDPKNPLVKSLEEQKIPFVTEYLAHITNLLSDRADHADIEKLKFYKGTGYISQYAFEGGSYELTTDDHNAINTALTTAEMRAQSKPTEHMSLLERMAEATGEDVAINTAALEKAALEKLTKDFNSHSSEDKKAAVSHALFIEPKSEILHALQNFLSKRKSGYSDYPVPLKIQGLTTVMRYMTTSGIWGRLQPRMPTPLEAALSALTDNSSTGLMQALKGNLAKSHNDRLSVGFQEALLSKLESLLPKFTVVYLTESTSRDSVPKGVMEDKANAQMVIDNGKYTLYIRGHDYVNGGITSLEVIHELLHSVLTASLMEPKNLRQRTFKAEMLALFEIAKANDKEGTWGERIFNQADEALALDEFIAYALTDQNFQRLLESIALPAKKTGWSQFVNGILGLLGLSNNQDTLLAAVIGTVTSELEARTLATDRIAKVTAIRSHTPSPVSLRDYTTEDVFDSLDTGTLESTFKSHLKGILNGMVDVFYGPFGIFGKERMEQQPISPLDVFVKAKVEGRMPFVSDIIASGFMVSEQEQFVAEQIEWVVRAALVDNEGHTTTVYTQLARMYKEAETKYPTPESFLDNWATASSQEREQATRLHESLFKLEMGKGKSDHIARFAAIVLGVKEANDKFKYASKNRDNTFDTTTISGKLLSWLNALLEMFESKMANTFVGQQADEKLLALVDGLVAIEAKKLHRLQAKRRNPSDMIEDGTNYLTDKIKEGIHSVATSKWVKENKNDFIGAAGALTAVIAGERVNQMLDMTAKLRDKAVKQKYGLIMGLLNETRGAVDNTVQFFALNRITKFLETQRKSTITRTANHILDSMGLKKDFTKDETEALTYYGLRSGLYTLLPMGLARIEQIMSSESELKDEMDKTIAEIMALGKYSNWFIQGAMKLGYSLVTDQAKGVATMTNAFSVASGDGTMYLGKIPDITRDAAIPLIDKLATLQAIKSGKKDKGQQEMGHRDLFAKILREQMARGDKGNGIEFLLLTHKELHAQAQDTLFKGNPRSIPKAYLPEITNPHVDVIVANEADGKQLIAAKYIKGREIVRSKYDTSGAGTMHVYVAKGGGMKPWLSGIFSFSGFGVKSKAIASEDMVYTERKLEVDLQMKAEHAEVTRIMTTPYTGFDPETVQGNYQFPLINTAGQVVKYEYRMDAMTRDTLLERDNRFHTLLGTLNGNMFDKETATVQNIKAVQALYDFYQVNKVGNMDSFALVSPLSPDPELRAIANMMPPETREAISKIWGSKGMYVRYDLLDINFGYRKPSIVSGLFKDAQAKKAYAEVITNIFTTFITRSNDEEDKAAARERARRWLTNQGDIWAELVAETKDFIVVKSGITLLHNVTSNFLELVALGINPMTILKHHRVAIKGILQHERDSKRLAELEHWVTVGFTQGREAAMRREIVVLRDALLGNPVDKLLKEGLMPTIVEDVSQSEDIYSHKSDLTQWVEGKMKKVNPKVRTVLRTAYMTKDSSLYKGLSTATQYSDFIARYTLYQHEISKKRNPLTHEQAIQSVSDAFINYDIPSHRKVQWANDVGLVMFTKYYIRIQKVILKIMKENPVSGLAMMLLNNYWDALPMLFDSGFLADSYGGGLFHTGAFELPGTLDGILTARVAGSVF